MKHWRIFVSCLIAVVLVGGGLFSFLHPDEGRKASGKECRPFVMDVDKADGQRIERLISTIARTSAVSLMFKQRELRKIGNVLDQNVPPFNFLAYIFAHPELARDMRLIQRSSLKYDHFLEGLQKNLVKEYQEGCLYTKAKGFSAYLQRDSNVIRKLLQDGIEEAQGNKKAFRAFVDYLIKTS